MGASPPTAAEQLLLVAYDPARRRVTGGPQVYLGAAGALVMDLLGSGVASLRDGRVAVDQAPSGDSPAAVAARAIALEPKARDIRHWVRHFAAPRFRLGQRLLAGLVAGGVLEARAGRRFGLFEVRRYELRNPAAREQVIASARAALLPTSSPAPPATSVVALLGACGLVDRVVARDERAAARRRAADLVRGDAGGAAVAGVAREVQGEVLTSVFAAVMAGTATGGGGDGHGGHGH